MGDLTRLKPSREDSKSAYRRTYPDAKPGNVSVSAGVLYRFVVEMQPGDIVVYPCKADRTINIGVIDGTYRYEATAPLDCPNLRPVKWIASCPREEFAQTALYEFGSFLTLFEIKNNVDEVLARMRGESYDLGSIDEASAEEVSKQAFVNRAGFAGGSNS